MTGATPKSSLFGRRRGALAAALLVIGVLAHAGLDTTATAEQAEGASTAVSYEQRRITAGGLHTCAVLDTGQVQCWGANGSGQLGNETTALPTDPPKVPGIISALTVTAGNSHTCALIHDGSVKCWGHNGSGQLGNGSTSPPDAPVYAPVDVTGIDDAVDLAAGGFHTCAVRAAGTVACWGHDGSGQLGDGGPTDRELTPVTVAHDHDDDPLTAPVELTGATAVTAGEFHSCAVLAAGGVMCWGHNGFGQLGNGVTLPNGADSALAVPVEGLPVDDGHAVADGDDHDGHKALAVSAGEGHTCAVIAGTPGNDDNTALCWGHNFYGQLGNASPYSDTATNQGATDSSTPVPVLYDASNVPNVTDIQPLEGVVSITAGQFHSCAGMSDGSARCWGNNGRGQLGDNNPAEDPPKNKNTATAVAALNGIEAVTAGGFHTCALLSTNTMSCWGYNHYAQLGGYNPSSAVPVTVSGLSGARAATAGDGHTCAVVESGVVPADTPLCWGENAHGKLGAGITPSPADSMLPLPVSGITDVGAVGLDADPSTLPRFLSAGNEHTCALPAPAGAPECWGRNDDGELGDSSITNATQIAAGGELFGAELGHSCARLADSSAWCWGDNTYGQLGNESTTDSTPPVKVRSDHDNDHLRTPPPDLTAPVDLAGASYVATGGRHSCALMADTTVRCWGRNFDGQLGDGTTGDRHFAVTVDLDPLEPEPDESDDHFDPLTGVVALAAGDRHTCAIKNDDTVWCWGRDADGQLGDGTAGASSTVPVQAGLDPGFFTPLGIAAGDRHTCARVQVKLTGSTTAACWGDNASGQLGNGGGPDSANPVVPTGLEAPGGDAAGTDLVKQVTAGRAVSCAVLLETTVRCWGDNTHGQLGDGVGQQSEAPIAVEHLDGPVGGNSLPVPVDDAVTVPNVAISHAIAVLANDTDADGDTLTVTQVEDPVRGTATNNGADISYQPDADFCDADPTSNTDVFRYWVTDGTAATPGPWAFVTVTVDCPNTAPDAVDDSASTNEDTAVTFDLAGNDSDINGDPVTISAVTQPANGTVAIVGPENTSVTYTPSPDFFGTDTFTYTATDGAADSAPATVTVTVQAVNDGPVAVDDNGATNEDTPVTIDVVSNDTDVDGPSLGVQSVADAPNGSTAKAGQTAVTYTPDADFCGVDGFTYAVTDGTLSDTGSVTVNVACQNDGPNAVNDSATTSEDTPVEITVLANDTDPEGDALTVTAATDPSHGTASINGGATVTYTPDPDFCGPDTFVYTISDGDDTDSAEVVPVVVLCVNDAPVANDDTATTAEDTAKTIDVLANDADVDGDTLTIVTVGDPASGSAAVSANVVNYTPDPDFCGADAFTYTATDPDGLTDTATVSVTVTCVNDAPVLGAVADVTTPWDEALDVALTSTDPDTGDTISYSLVQAPAGASIAGTSVVWTPSNSQLGANQFRVRGTDGDGASDDETFTVTVTRRATALTYTGATSGQYSDPAAVSATLVDFEGAPVAGRPVSFTIGSRTASATSDGSGVAAGTLILGSPVGPTSVEVGFAGDTLYETASTSAAFTVEKEEVTVSFAGRYVTETTSGASSVQLTAVVAEEADGHLGSGIGTLQVRFSALDGGTLCTGGVSMTVFGAGTASCSTASLPVGSYAVVAQVIGAAYEGDVDVGTFVVANGETRGAAFGAGTIDDGGPESFAFGAEPVRKAAPAGDALHVYRTGGTAIVVATDTLTSLATSCTGGKTKVCTATVAGVAADRWSVELSTGAVTVLAGTTDVTLQAGDDNVYAVTLTGADAHSSGPASLTAGTIRVL